MRWKVLIDLANKSAQVINPDGEIGYVFSEVTRTTVGEQLKLLGLRLTTPGGWKTVPILNAMDGSEHPLDMIDLPFSPRLPINPVLWPRIDRLAYARSLARVEVALIRRDLGLSNEINRTTGRWES